MKNFLFLTAATATVVLSASQKPPETLQKRVLATLSVDVEHQETGEVSTTIIGLHDGESPLEVAKTFCKTVTPPSEGCDDTVAEALQSRFQQRVDNDMQFFFTVNNDDGDSSTTVPFLFFRGDDVSVAVASYLSAHGIASQSNYDMLLEASMKKLEEQQNGKEDETNLEVEEDIAVVVPPVLAGKHCRLATSTFSDYVDCVRELRHGMFALQRWTEPQQKAKIDKSDDHIESQNEDSGDVLMFVISALIFAACCVAAVFQSQETDGDNFLETDSEEFQVVSAENVSGYAEQAKENAPIASQQPKKLRRSTRRRFGTSIHNAN